MTSSNSVMAFTIPMLLNYYWNTKKIQCPLRHCKYIVLIQAAARSVSTQEICKPFYIRTHTSYKDTNSNEIRENPEENKKDNL